MGLFHDQTTTPSLILVAYLHSFSEFPIFNLIFLCIALPVIWLITLFSGVVLEYDEVKVEISHMTSFINNNNMNNQEKVYT